MLWPLVPLLLGEVVRGRRELVRHYADRAARAEAERERRRGAGWSRNGCASPARCTTWWPTPCRR
ncbi:hypothetical protein ACFQ60_05685 [Streptomyces zhihengii]